MSISAFEFDWNVLIEAVQEVHVDNYYKEMAFISFFVLYLLNYIYGASKNKTMATRW